MTSNITKKIIEDLIASDKKGLEEYGVTVDREDYTLRDWLQEAYEETCDTAKYLKAAIEKLETAHQMEIESLQEGLQDGILKRMRRRLPVTGQKFDWDNAKAMLI